MAQRWNYTGDVNLEHGGLFWREGCDSTYVDAVDVSPCSDAGGASNLYHIGIGSIPIPRDADKLAKICATIGADPATVDRRTLVEAARAYFGVEMDHQEVIRIGPDESDDFGRGYNPEPTRILRADARLENYVRREVLRHQ